MAKVKITQVKSVIDRPERQKKTMLALGIKKNASLCRSRADTTDIRHDHKSESPDYRRRPS